MKTKTSITLSEDIVKTIDRIARAGGSRSQAIERLPRERLAAEARRAADQRDLELMNRHVDQLNAEAAEVLQYQVDQRCALTARVARSRVRLQMRAESRPR